MTDSISDRPALQPERLTRQDRQITAYCPAKINLTLRVIGRRADGYHDLESIFVAVDLYDRLRIRRCDGGEIRFDCAAAAAPTDRSNLVWRAAELFAERSGRCEGLRIELEKRIPPGSGLGGGSSDAAATLLGLDHLFQTRFSRRTLSQWGAALGSDVPFFFHTPAAICRGRGQQVEPIQDFPALTLLLVLPPLHVSTAAVYQRFHLDQQTATPTAEAVLSDRRPWNRKCYNSLSTAAFAVEPQLKELHAALGSILKCPVHLSGSGAALFLVADDQQAAERLAQAARDLTPDVRIVHTNRW